MQARNYRAASVSRKAWTCSKPHSKAAESKFDAAIGTHRSTDKYWQRRILLKPDDNPLFRYPLRLECLSLIGLLSVLFYILLGVGLFSYVISFGAPLYPIALYAVLILINILFEYGLDIIEDSAKGKSDPPQFSNDIINIVTGRGRFLRQSLMILLFGGLVLQLFSAGFDYLALVVICFVLLIFPASLVVNSLYENLLAIINPVSLIGFAVIAGRDYLIMVAALAATLTLFYVALLVSPVTLLLYLPLGLYSLLVYFRYLGLVAFRCRDMLSPQQDYQADDRAIDQHFADNAKLHELLNKAYWQMKENRVDEVISLLDPAIKLGAWARFDFIFSAMSDWPNKKPALHFIKLYIPHLLEKQNAMRTFGLCQWAMDQDSKFTINSGAVLERLHAASASEEQFRVLVKLLDNFVDSNPAHESSTKYLSMAADICQSKLHNEEKSKHFQRKLENLKN